MNKTMKLSACAILALGLFSSTAFADEKDEIIKQLTQRLDNMEKELQELKNTTSSLKSDTDKQIEELHTRADDNEFEAALSKVKFGFDFENSVNFLSGDYMGEKIDSKEKWVSIFHLNMSANVNDKTNFYGRLGVSRNWADYTTGFTNDYNQGRNSDGGTLVFLERAYFDYRITENLIVTLGRQPGSDGPGSNLRNNSTRQATYPALLFSANGDGLVFTYKPEIGSLENVAFRLGYSKMYQWDNGSDSSIFGDEQLDDGRIFLGMAEAKLPFGAMGDNLLIFQAVKINDATLKTSALGELNFGDLTYADLYFENNQAFGSNLNYFLSLAYMKGSNAKDNSALIAQKIKNDNFQKAYMAAYLQTGDKAAATAAATGILTQATQGAIAQTKLNEEDAWALHIGARYDFNDAFKLGYQYFHGSKFWYSTQAVSAADPLNVTQTRGDAHDIYAIYQIDFNQFLRLSYTHVNYKYSGSGRPVGMPVKIDDSVSNIMLTYNIRF